MIGADPTTGTLRWTMGMLYLWDGMHLVPVVLGIFALPELADMAIERAASPGMPRSILGPVNGKASRYVPSLVSGRTGRPHRIIAWGYSGYRRICRRLDRLRSRGTNRKGRG